MDENQVNELIKNNVSLQNATLDLIESVNKLTERMDRILSLFEEAAKNIEKSEVEEPLANKLEELLEQNKVIARGLVLIEKFIREKQNINNIGMRSEFQPSSLTNKPLPKLI